MSNRRTRKRSRRKVETTAKTPIRGGLWGDVRLSRSDMLLIWKAIDQDWPVPVALMQSIVSKLVDEIEQVSPRRSVAIARLILAMEKANMRAEEQDG